LGIAGLGLIGGSLAKALSPFDGLEINVYDGDPATIEELKLVRRYKNVVQDPDDFIGLDLDLAYLCMPVHRNIEMIEKMGHRKVSYAVTDSGSTKCATNKAALKAGLNFCGGHPIAGKEVAGYGNSTPDLIPGCLFILTPDPLFGARQKELLGRLKALHELLGCHIEILSPEEHDELYSLVSHLPYLTASALTGTVMGRGGPEVLSFAGTGFKDTTRVSASPPEKWVAVILDNAENLARDLGSLMEVISELKKAVEDKNGPLILSLLDSFANFRRKLESSKKDREKRKSRR
jgi:prephenate dehydrogenase